MTEIQRQTAGDSIAGRLSYFISAPSSPSRVSEFYQDFNDFTQEFAFHVAGDNTPASASELFSGGIIRSPLAKPETVSVKIPLLSAVGSPRSKGSNKKRFWSNFGPKKKKHDNQYARVVEDNFRGRERVPQQSTSATPRRREARSLSPVRPPCSPLTVVAAVAGKSSRKWRLKNFLLFRSASEGRASDKDPTRKVTSFYRRSQQEDVAKGSNSRSTMEKHYTLNKAASEDLKKKTFLPYKQGILGRLAVNPTVHSLAHGSLPSS